MKQYYIYLTTNKINGKRYIGKHYGELDDTYLGSGTKLRADIKIYGKENFEREILYISNSEIENCHKEQEFIAAFDAVNRDDFYNIHEGGQGGNTIAGWSQEEKEEYSKRKSEQTSGVNNPRYGKHLTEETKNKIRQNRDTEYMTTDEYKQAMSKAVRGEKNGMYGKHHTEEAKANMSKHSKGKTSGSKNGMYGKSKENAINGQHIIMRDSHNQIIHIFASKTAALDFLGMKGHVGLDKAIQNHTLYKNYYWSVETK